jgi:hypothetical protein
MRRARPAAFLFAETSGRIMRLIGDPASLPMEGPLSKGSGRTRNGRDRKNADPFHFGAGEARWASDGGAGRAKSGYAGKICSHDVGG